jgi:hypothetical protein
MGIGLGLAFGVALQNFALGLGIGVLADAAMRLVPQRRARGEEN